MNECISSVNNKSICFSSKPFFDKHTVYFSLYNQKNINVDKILFFNFENISYFDRKFYIVIIYFSPKWSVNLSDFCRVMISRMYISDQTPFKALIIAIIWNLVFLYSSLTVTMEKVKFLFTFHLSSDVKLKTHFSRK